MRLKHLKNSKLEPGNHFDLVIVGLGPESRSRNVVEKYFPDAILKVTLQDGNAIDELAFEKNQQVLIEAGYVVHRAEKIYDLINAIPKNDTQHPLSVLIDISCLYRPTLASVVVTLTRWAETQEVKITFAYSLAQFTPPSEISQPNEAIAPVHDLFSGWPSTHSNPTSLIIGLGYEPDKAEGASEYLDPGEQWGFIPISSEDKFLPEVETNNAHLISRLKSVGHLIRYEVPDCERTFGQLELVLSELLRTTNPVLLPFGPKVFFSLCLIQSIVHPEVGVWHVTGEKDELPVDRKPSGVDIAYEVLLGRA